LRSPEHSGERFAGEPARLGLPDLRWSSASEMGSSLGSLEQGPQRRRRCRGGSRLSYGLEGSVQLGVDDIAIDDSVERTRDLANAPSLS
jgi:hypothetical protein